MNTVTGVTMWRGLSWLMVGASDGPRQHGDVLWVGFHRPCELAWSEARHVVYQTGFCCRDLSALFICVWDWMSGEVDKGDVFPARILCIAGSIHKREDQLRRKTRELLTRVCKVQ